mmetsp:Transcript_84859/g.263553  ORF Transcript_84859/g.263553 Transcript_84859/m.263553 type:complete len:369 (-) Transcript_84859:103-1209(-)
MSRELHACTRIQELNTRPKRALQPNNGSMRVPVSHAFGSAALQGHRIGSVQLFTTRIRHRIHMQQQHLQACGIITDSREAMHGTTLVTIITTAASVTEALMHCNSTTNAAPRFLPRGRITAALWAQISESDMARTSPLCTGVLRHNLCSGTQDGTSPFFLPANLLATLESLAAVLSSFLFVTSLNLCGEPSSGSLSTNSTTEVSGVPRGVAVHEATRADLSSMSLMDESTSGWSCNAPRFCAACNTIPCSMVPICSTTADSMPALTGSDSGGRLRSVWDVSSAFSALICSRASCIRSSAFANDALAVSTHFTLRSTRSFARRTTRSCAAMRAAMGDALATCSLRESISGCIAAACAWQPLLSSHALVF